MKNRFYILIAFVLLILSCSVDQKEKYSNGNYYFKYLGNKSVCFCGWSREAIEQSEGVVYVPEKIYDFDVVEVGISYQFSPFYLPFINLNHIKSIVVPEYIETVRLDSYEIYGDFYWNGELHIPEGITDISLKALNTFNHFVNEIILPRSLKRIDCPIFDGDWRPNEGWRRSLKFQDPSNWYVKKDDNSPWQPIDVSDPHINAENLAKKYSSYIWEKRP